MSKNAPDDNRSDVECPITDCSFTTHSDCGVKQHIGRSHSMAERKQILQGDLRTFAKRLGRTPTKRDMAGSGPWHYTVYQDVYGSWNAALENAGLEPNHVINVPDDELLAEIVRVAEVLDHPPTYDEMAVHGQFYAETYENRFGTWATALEKAGFSPSKVSTVTTQELLDDLHRVAEKLERAPRCHEMTIYGRHGAGSYYNHFKTWNEALTIAGFETYETPCGEDNPLWKGGTFPYGSGWNDAKKEQVRERDGRECQCCGRAEEEHIELYGRKHSVHHIQKARDFDDPEQRNHPDNLITLCESKECHKRWEQMSPLRPQVAADD